MIKIAINGFGRIGRSALKIALERRDVEVVAINDLANTKTLARLLKYDSTYGIYEKRVSFDDKNIVINTRRIPVFSEKDATNLPWKKLKVDVVLDCAGLFSDPKRATSHLKAGAKKVVLAAPSKDNNIKTIVIGANEENIEKNDTILSDSSSTTNCVAPILNILENNFGVEKSAITSIHSYISNQHLQDAPGKSIRESRAATENIIPAATETANILSSVLPSTKGKSSSISIYVPTPSVALADITAVLKTKTTKEELIRIFKHCAKEPYYEGILDTTNEELVSSDFRGNSHSCIVDLPLIDVIDGDLIKIFTWYDNEWGHANRLVELAVDFGKNKK